MKTIRFLLIGAGNVGRRFLELITLKRDSLCNRLGLDLVLVGVADRSGVAICPAGLDPRHVVELKLGGHGVATYPRWGRAGVSGWRWSRQHRLTCCWKPRLSTCRTETRAWPVSRLPWCGGCMWSRQ